MSDAKEGRAACAVQAAYAARAEARRAVQEHVRVLHGHEGRTEPNLRRLATLRLVEQQAEERLAEARRIYAAAAAA